MRVFPASFSNTARLWTSSSQSGWPISDRCWRSRAKCTDWEPEVAGQRVQIIKPDPHRAGILEFGTELVPAHDNSLVALLGASPGASTAVFIALGVLEKCF